MRLATVMLKRLGTVIIFFFFFLFSKDEKRLLHCYKQKINSVFILFLKKSWGGGIISERSCDTEVKAAENVALP